MKLWVLGDSTSEDGGEAGGLSHPNTVSLTCGCGPWRCFVGTVELDGEANAHALPLSAKDV